MRFGIQPKIKELRPEVDIIDHPEFETSESMYQAVRVRMKREGKGKIENKPSICAEDMEKMYSSGVLSNSTPRSLQRKVFFELSLFFCRRGSENLRELKKDSFAVKTSAQGSEYVIQVTDELTKNHGPYDDPEDGGIMMATGKIILSFIYWGGIPTVSWIPR